MKKTIIIAIAMALMSAQVFAFKIEAKGAYFMPSEKAFKNIYGGGPIVGAEIAFKLFGPVDMWIEGNYFTAKGKLTYTEEATTLKIIPAGCGLRYTYSPGKVSLYGGAGARYYQYEESNPIGTAKKGGVGFVVNGGACLRLAGKLFLDVRLGYAYCQMKPADFKINIGGLEAGGGLVIVF